MAVIAAVELDNFIALGKAARQPDCGHGGFGSGIAHSYLLHTGHPGADQSGHRHLQWIWNTKAGSDFSGCLHRSDDFRMRMAENGWTPSAHIVQILVAIDIPKVRAFGFVN